MGLYEDLLADMPAIQRAVNGFTSESVQRKAIDALLRAKCGVPVAPSFAEGNSATPEQSAGGEMAQTEAITESDHGTKSGKSRRSAAKPKAIPPIDKDLLNELRTGLEFSELVATKKPGSHEEKVCLSVYYLREHHPDLNVGISHIHSCYKAADWRLPTNPSNVISKAGTPSFGYIDPSDRNSIQLTTVGQALIERDLPRVTTRQAR